MYTRCPACKAQFKVRAAHLTAAHGQVRCGACGHAFDALIHLSDTLVPLSEVEKSGLKQNFAIRSEPDMRMGVADLDEPDLPGGMRSREADDAAENESVDELLRAPDIRREDYDLDTTVWTDEDAPPRRSRLWWALAAVLVFIGVGQVGWFNRDVIYHHYPQVQPWVEQMCLHLGCEVYRERRADAIELLDRDVRLHPVYEDVLLVNATIANRAGRRQPYPYIELALYDTGGEAIAYRRFAPKDYLDDSLPVAAGMQPDTPMHVVLEISGPTVEAVSFEFGFL